MQVASDSVRISNKSAATARLIAAFFVGPLALLLLYFALAILTDSRREISPTLGVLCLITALGVGAMVTRWLVRLTFWIEFGDSIRVRRMLGVKQFAWSDIDGVTFKTDGQHQAVVVEPRSGPSAEAIVAPTERTTLDAVIGKHTTAPHPG